MLKENVELNMENNMAGGCASKRAPAITAKTLPSWGPQLMEKTEVATQPVHFWGPQNGEKWLHTPCRLGSPNKGRNQSGYITPAFPTYNTPPTHPPMGMLLQCVGTVCIVGYIH